MLQNLQERLVTLTGARVLDVATGEGKFGEFLLSLLQDCSVAVGVDISLPRLYTARSRIAGSRLNLIAARGERLPFQDDSFDLVAISNALHHLEFPELILTEMKRVLKPGGVFVISELFADQQGETQLTHVALHHWWAAVDTALGITHYTTFTRYQLLGLVWPLNLADLEVFEHTDTLSDPRDCERLSEMKARCAQYLERIQSHNRHSELAVEGRKLLRRLDDVGLNWASELCMVGRKSSRMLEHFEVP